MVVATHERSALLRRLVAALEAQRDAPPFEVVIVDDGSKDDTWAVLGELGAQSSVPLRPLRLDENRGPATARNVGWRAATAPLIAFTDDDCTPQPGWMRALGTALTTYDIALGATEPDPAQEENRGPFSHTMRIKGESGYYPTCNVGYRRDVLERAAGFDERFRYAYGEDADLAWRAKEAGARSTFVADAVVLHDIRPGSVRSYLADLRRRSGVVVLAGLHPGMRSLLHRGIFFRPSHPTALVAAAGIAAAIAPVPAPWRLLGAALITPYVRHRRAHPMPGLRWPGYRAVPVALATDLLEVAVLARASLRFRRFRTLVL